MHRNWPRGTVRSKPLSGVMRLSPAPNETVRSEMRKAGSVVVVVMGIPFRGVSASG